MYEVLCDGDKDAGIIIAFLVVSAGGKVMDRFPVNQAIEGSEALQRGNARFYCNRLNHPKQEILLAA